MLRAMIWLSSSNAFNYSDAFRVGDHGRLLQKTQPIQIARRQLKSRRVSHTSTDSDLPAVLQIRSPQQSTGGVSRNNLHGQFNGIYLARLASGSDTLVFFKENIPYKVDMLTARWDIVLSSAYDSMLVR